MTSLSKTALQTIRVVIRSHSSFIFFNILSHVENVENPVENVEKAVDDVDRISFGVKTSI